MKVTCCILFNHAYPENIPILRQMYRNRFDHLLFLQPLERSMDVDVMTVYRGSYNFHGMIVDAADRLLSTGSDYFVFVHDDVLLNPRYDGEQLVKLLNVPANGAFMPSIWALHGEIQNWSWQAGLIWKFLYPMNTLSGSGVNTLLKHLPDATEVKERLQKSYGFKFEGFHHKGQLNFKQHNLLGNPDTCDLILENILQSLQSLAGDDNRLHLPYPFCGGISDFFVLDRDTYMKAVPILGAFAAANLFVEVAIPTSIMITADKVIMERDVGMRTKWVWSREDYNAVTDSELIEGFKNDLLLLHPAKLSSESARFRRIVSNLAPQNYPRSTFAARLRSFAARPLG